MQRASTKVADAVDLQKIVDPWIDWLATCRPQFGLQVIRNSISADRVNVDVVGLPSLELAFAVVEVANAIYFLHVACCTNTQRKPNDLIFIESKLLLSLYIGLFFDTDTIQAVKLDVLQEDVAAFISEEFINVVFQIADHLLLRLEIHKLQR
jgi:hypothetical protein